MATVDDLIGLISDSEYEKALAMVDADPALATARSSRPGQMLGETPLHRAAHRNAADFCERLIELGADVNDSATSWWLTPLAWAADAASVDAVALLLRHGADVNQDAVVRTTALHAAAMGGSSRGARDPAGYRQTAEQLIVHGVDHDRRTTTSRHTALDEAIINENVAVEEVLRRHGAKRSAELDE